MRPHDLAAKHDAYGVYVLDVGCIAVRERSGLFFWYGVIEQGWKFLNTTWHDRGATYVRIPR